MKSRRVKATAKSKAFLSKKKLKGNLPLDVSDSGSDIDSESFFHDEIDDFHKDEEDQLSTDDELIQHKDESSEEEEVLPITDDERDDSGEDQLKKCETDDSDSSSESESDADLPNPEAWGKRKYLYYNADFVDEDRGRTYREEDAEAAKAEADEAFAIQKSVYSNISADHLGTNLFLEGSESSSEEESTEEDLVSATKHEKIKFLKKTNPEMFDLIDDFKPSMYSIPNKLPYLLSIPKDNKLPLEAAAEFIKIKYQLLLHYTANILFYMSLKAKNVKVHHHPVQKKLSTYKKILSHLTSIDAAVDKDDAQMFVDKVNEMQEAMLKGSSQKKNVIKNDSISQSLSDSAKPTEERVKRKKSKEMMVEAETEEEIQLVVESLRAEMKRKQTEKTQDETVSDPEKNPTEEKVETKKSKRKAVETVTEMEITSLIEDVKAEVKRRRTEKDQKETQEVVNLAESGDGQELAESGDDQGLAESMNDQEDNQIDEKRTITYQIAKNKGLAPRRKKEYRNPRVKHRMKFRKAKIRRKGQVREVVKEIKRYEGEPTGISTHVVKSIKLK